jgi:hypothetical protein
VKIRDEAAATAKAEAIKAGKSEAEAEQVGMVAGLKAENEWFAAEQTKGIEERQKLQEQIADDLPFTEAGRKKADSEKDAATRISELQAEREKDRAALIAERRDSRLRNALAKVDVRAERMDAAVRLVDAEKLTFDEKTGTFSGLDEAATWFAKEFPEFVGEARSSSAANDRAGKGGAGASIKRAVFEALSPSAQMEHIKKGGVVTDYAARTKGRESHGKHPHQHDPGHLRGAGCRLARDGRVHPLRGARRCGRPRGAEPDAARPDHGGER